MFSAIKIENMHLNLKHWKLNPSTAVQHPHSYAFDNLLITKLSITVVSFIIDISDVYVQCKTSDGCYIKVLNSWDKEQVSVFPFTLW